MRRLAHCISASLAFQVRRNRPTLDGIGAALLRVCANCLFAAFALTVHAAPFESAKMAAGASHPPAVAVDDDDLWSPLFHGPGVSSSFGPYPTVRTLGVLADQLIVAGRFKTAGPVRAENIARWNGSSWTAMGTGLTGNSTWDAGQVECLAVFNGQLVAGGHFNHSGDTLLGGIAAWDGQEWQPLGGGFNGTVRGLAVHDGLLVAVGDFDAAAGLPAQHVAAWDGRIWRSLASDMLDEVQRSRVGYREDPPPRVLSVASFHGDLYIGGSFTRINGTPIRDIARWSNGVWFPVGPGTDGNVTSLEIHDDALFVGGSFARVGDLRALGLARWDGAAWSRLGEREVPWDTGYVAGLAELGGKLAVVGSFSILNHEFTLLLWNGRRWERTSATTLRIAAALEYQGRLFVGGTFAEGTPVPLNNVAIWAGDRWDPVGPGAGLAKEDEFAEYNAEPFPDENVGPPFRISVPDPEPGPSVGMFAEYQGELIAAGRFDWAGQERVDNIARWDGATWKPLGGGIKGGVGAVTVFGGELVAGGTFDRAGDVPVHNVAAWDGTRWRALGDGPAGVSSFTEYQGKLIAAGGFNRVAGQEAHGVASWDGERWTRIGFGLFDRPRFVIVHDATLIAAGDIDWTGYRKVDSVVRWTGEVWESLGSGLGRQEDAVALLETDGGLLAIFRSGDMYFWDGVTWTLRGRIPFYPTTAAMHAGTLYAAGLRSESHISYPEIARWDGVAWRPIGSGINYFANALWPSGGSLYVGGRLHRAGPYVSLGVARWDGLDIAPAVPGEPAAATTPLSRRTELTLMGPGRDGNVRVHYSLATDAVPLRLAIYDVRGRLVRVLDQATSGGGTHERTWDRLDAGGTAVARGAYFVRLEAGRERLTRKLMLWK